MKTRACLGWLSVMLLAGGHLSLAQGADKPATPDKSAPASDSDSQDLDDDLDLVESTHPLPATPSPATPSAYGAMNTTVAPEEKPDRYVIQKGDTLWDISSRFWGDPYFWPKLWSYNPYIGNAHLIYPGNILRFNPGSYVRPPTMDIEGSPPGASAQAQAEEQETVQPESVVAENKACSPPVPFLESDARSIDVRSAGFIREQGFGPVGKITKAPDSKSLLSDRDIVYLQFDRVADVQCGDRYTVYEPTRKKVAHPIYRRRVVGSLYRVLGEVEVIDVNDFIATGRIIETYAEIGRGHLLTPRVEVNHTVAISSNSREVEGFIVESLNQESSTLSTNDVIYIDRGEQDGVNAGDPFYVVRQGDGLEGLLTKGKRDISLPYQVVGKVVVVNPGEFVSEAVITEASGVIEVGDHITTQIN